MTVPVGTAEAKLSTLTVIVVDPDHGIEVLLTEEMFVPAVPLEIVRAIAGLTAALKLASPEYFATML
jgi:hypothetical protein